MTNKRKNSDSLASKMREAHRNRRRRSNKILLIGLAACGVLFAGTAIIGGIFVMIEREAVINTYGEQIAGLCRDVPIGEATLDNAPNTDGPSQLLLLRTGIPQRHAWHNQLPLAWRADSADAVDVVGCVETRTVDIEVCEYLRNTTGDSEDSYTLAIDREQTTVTITLLNAATGERIAEQSVTGTEPPPCPPDSDELGVSTRLEGSEPTAEDFAPWLEGFIN